MKSKLFFKSILEILRPGTNWFKQANEQPAPRPPISSADINAFRQYLANNRQYN